VSIKDWRPPQGLIEEDAIAFAREMSDFVSRALGVPIGFVAIPPGTFLMGSKDGSESERPVHGVTLTRWIWMQETEVTQAQWKAVTGKNPSYFKGPDRPVEQVSWNDCMEFIHVLAPAAPRGFYFDLPTEAEWEYACRAGSKGKWCFGNDESKLGEYAWYYKNSGNETHPVGQLKPNAWGLYDMHGNVWEWCRDWYGAYGEIPQTDPLGPSHGEYRLLRGGCWYYSPWITRSANRDRDVPTYRGNSVGMRAVLR